jgi:hypothetical protein
VDGGVAWGILGLVALSLAGAVALRLLLQSPRLINWLFDDAAPRLRRRLIHRVEQPAGRPIQEIAASIRRLGSAYYEAAPGRSWVKSEAFRRAYDGALAEGCLALDVQTDLLEIPPGTERDAERLRVEHLLMDAGLVLRRAA